MTSDQFKSLLMVVFPNELMPYVLVTTENHQSHFPVWLEHSEDVEQSLAEDKKPSDDQKLTNYRRLPRHNITLEGRTLSMFETVADRYNAKNKGGQVVKTKLDSQGWLWAVIPTT